MKEFKTIHLKGTQADMGEQYGRIVRERGGYEESTDLYPRIAESLLADANSHSGAGRLLHGAIKQMLHWGAKRLDKQRPAPYRERSLAFINQLGLPRELSRQYMLMDLFQNVLGLAGRLRLGPFARKAGLHPIPACSSLMVWDEASDDGTLRHARNFDFTASGVFDAEPAIVFCEPDEGIRYGYVGSFGVDIPGVTGFNEAGLVITAHTRFHRDVAFSGAAIIDLCHDIVRRAETLDDVVKIANERPIASTWGLAVSSGREREGIVLETTAKKVAVLRHQRDESHVAVTNFYRHPDLQNGQLIPSPAFGEYCDGREETLNRLARKGGLSRTDMENALGDHCDPFSDVGPRAAGGVVSQAITVQSVVFEPEVQSVQVSVGDAPTGWGPYVEAAWDWAAPVGMQIQEVDETEGRITSGYGDGPKGEAYELWLEATRVDVLHHNPEETGALIQKAVRLDPTAPSYRFMAAMFELRKGHFAKALEHLEVGLEHEQATFRRAQSLLWASRAAHHAGDPGKAKAMRAEIRILNDPYIDELQEMARKEERKPYSAGKLRKVSYNIMMVDAL